MIKSSEYAEKYENIRFERREGVMQVTLHTGGGPFVFSEQAHHDLGLAFTDLANDSENKVIILTGTGDRFCADFDYGSFMAQMQKGGEGIYRLRTDGRRMLATFLDIEVPVIAAINGPALSHSELPLLADLVIASDNTVFQDATHFVIGAVPGDGIQTVWTTLLGLNRGRYFLMTGQKLTAQQALDLGVVGEVLPLGDLQARAWELALHWARLPRPTLISTRHALTYEWKRLFLQELHNGLTEEFLPTAGAAFPDIDPKTIPPADLLASA